MNVMDWHKSDELIKKPNSPLSSECFFFFLILSIIDDDNRNINFIIVIIIVITKIKRRQIVLHNIVTNAIKPLNWMPPSLL